MDTDNTNPTQAHASTTFDSLEDALAHPAPSGPALSEEELSEKIAHSEIDIDLDISLPNE